MPSMMTLFKDLAGDIRLAAAQTHRQPTDGQKDAGNYRKGRFRWQGMEIAIENPKGSWRSGKGWRQQVKHHYGYIVNSEASDEDDVDVFVGPDPAGAPNVYVVNQVKPNGAFDEHKCMIGFHSIDEARRGYLANYERGWRCGPITEVPVEEFKRRVLAGEFAKGHMRKAMDPVRPGKSAQKGKSFLFFVNMRKAYNPNEQRDERGRWTRVDSPEFRAWFGRSKVVDPAGKPLVVYKGMYPYDWRGETKDSPGPIITQIDRGEEFPSFHPGDPGIKVAGFFGDRETANRFALGIGTRSAVYPVYLSLQKPYMVDAKGRKAGDIQFGATGQPFRDAIRSGKYDGAIIRNTADEGDIYVALKATQIKSAMGNSGGFDPNDPDLRKAYDPQEPRVPAGKPEGGQWTRVDRSATVPRGIVEVLVSRIKVDPRRFQFKQNVDPTTGAGLELKDVKRFDPELAGVVLVWQDPANGRTYVVNGHHRVELARRHRVQRIAVRYIDAPNAHKAMLKGALCNLAEGRGTAIDGAKLMRTAHLTQRSLENAGVSIRGQLAKQSLGLSKLSDAIFAKVVKEEIPIERGALIGEYFATHHEQDALLAMLKRNEIRGHRLTNAEVAELARFVRTAGRRKETITSLFGDEEIERSLAIEKAQLSAWMKLRLLYDKRMFSYVSARDVAEGLKRSESHINVEKSRELARETRIIEDVWNRLIDLKGPLNAALNVAAKRLARGDHLNAIRNDLYQQASAAVKAELQQGHFQEPEPSLF